MSAKPATPTKPATRAKAKTTTATAKKSTKAAATKSTKAAPALTAKQKAAAHVAHEKHVAHEQHLAHLAAEGKPVAFGIGEYLPVCAFEAVAQSLRLLGARVHGDDVGELWHLLGEPDATSVGAALAAAALFGLAGYGPRAERLRIEVGALGAATPVPVFVPLDLEGSGMDGTMAVVDGAEEYPVLASAAREHPLNGKSGLVRIPAGALLRECLTGHGLILSVDVPGPHAVLATPAGWWSWGELYDPWPCRVSEAWAVSWS